VFGFPDRGRDALALADEKAEQLFVRRIVPLLAGKCLACHGQDEAKIKGGLDLRSLAAVLEGGDSGLPAPVPGKPEESPLYLAATRTHDDWEPMPPKEAHTRALADVCFALLNSNEFADVY
jgi:hypothetical protein